MGFQEATDALMAEGVTLEEIAETLGVAYTTVRAYRLDPRSASYRKPPKGWGPPLARLARSQSGRLANLADQLERGG